MVVSLIAAMEIVFGQNIIGKQHQVRQLFCSLEITSHISGKR